MTKLNYYETARHLRPTETRAVMHSVLSHFFGHHHSETWKRDVKEAQELHHQYTPFFADIENREVPRFHHRWVDEFHPAGCALTVGQLRTLLEGLKYAKQNGLSDRNLYKLRQVVNGAYCQPDILESSREYGSWCTGLAKLGLVISFR